MENRKHRTSHWSHYRCWPASSNCKEADWTADDQRRSLFLCYRHHENASVSQWKDRGLGFGALSYSLSKQSTQSPADAGYYPTISPSALIGSKLSSASDGASAHSRAPGKPWKFHDGTRCLICITITSQSFIILTGYPKCQCSGKLESP